MLFAQAAKECGNDLTRKCVYDNAKKVTDWTGGGLHSKQNPSTGKAGECFTHRAGDARRLQDTRTSQPNDGDLQLRPERNVYVLKGDYGKGVTLADVGKSMSDLK